MDAKPYSKESQLARGERRYRRKVASPKQWQAIITAKRGPCRWCEAFGSAGRREYGPIEFHHVVRRNDGGDDVPDNIVPLHQFCHRQMHESGRTPLGKIGTAHFIASLSDAEYART